MGREQRGKWEGEGKRTFLVITYTFSTGSTIVTFPLKTNEMKTFVKHSANGNKLCCQCDSFDSSRQSPKISSPYESLLFPDGQPLAL